jgi:4-amino-4-deoxy-L-arabinose transferase-like glycosyltransferase
MKPAKIFWAIIIILAFVKFILPFILPSPVFELQRDEYLYYQQGLHFDIGYMENPPLLSWLATVSSWLGGSVFWIKFWPAMVGSLTLILTCKLSAEFGGQAFAQFLAGLATIAGGYLRVHSLFQPNFLDIFFWTLSIYFIVRLFNSGSEKYLFYFTISLALGFWSKYSVVFVAASLLLSLLMTYHRDLFMNKKTWLAILLGVILIMPNVWWQFDHRWPLVHHMAELQQTQLQYVSPADFIKDQFLMLMPALFVWIGGLIWLFRQRQWRFLGFSYLLVIILLILGRGKSYYSLGIYPMLIAAGGTAWERLSVRRMWIRMTMTGIVFLLWLPVIPLLLPVWNPEKLAHVYQKRHLEKLGVLKWEDQQNHLLPQDFADMLGWKELTEKTERFFDGLPDSVKSSLIIYCRNYGQAGALNYYGKNADFRSRLISDNGSFLLWLPANLDFKHLIYVGHRIPPKDDTVFQHFESMRIIDSVSNIYSRQLGDKIIFYSNADAMASKLAREIIAEKKREFGR